MEELEVCPICHEDAACIDTEGNWRIFVRCSCCGSQTVNLPFKNEQEKTEAEKQVIRLWNMGKVIAENRGE